MASASLIANLISKVRARIIYQGSRPLFDTVHPYAHRYHSKTPSPGVPLCTWRLGRFPTCIRKRRRTFPWPSSQAAKSTVRPLLPVTSLGHVGHFHVSIRSSRIPAAWYRYLCIPSRGEEGASVSRHAHIGPSCFGIVDHDVCVPRHIWIRSQYCATCSSKLHLAIETWSSSPRATLKTGRAGQPPPGTGPVCPSSCSLSTEHWPILASSYIRD
ncbi:hypothetical protein GGR52DRAFT_494280 [Hypoxylon sp. FL1284]|nr:hypothetical protein GGR52DRAFT_494280 [Hypoxylon sp. FL1284]